MILVTIPDARLCADPRVNDLPSGSKVANLRVASNYRVKDDAGEWTSEALFFDVEIWRGAETIEEYFGKGSPIVVWGELQERSWTDRDGNARTNLTVRNASWTFPPKNDGADADESAPRQARQKPAAAPKPAAVSAADFGDEDIPF
jgi:single stranded DNA-binding protein